MLASVNGHQDKCQPMPAEKPQSIPAYQRIRNALRTRIESSQYREGDRLPPESELVEEFGVARMTVRQALAQLEFENLILRRPGLGTFVAARRNVVASIDSASHLSFEEQVSAQGQTPRLKLLGFRMVAAAPEVAEQLGIAAGTDVYCLERLRYVDEQLIGLEIRYIIQPVGQYIPKDRITNTPTFTLLAIALGEPLDTVDVSLFAASATKETAARLKLRRGAPILVREHLGLDSAGRTVLFGKSIYSGNLRFRNVFRRPRTVE